MTEPPPPIVVFADMGNEERLLLIGFIRQFITNHPEEFGSTNLGLEATEENMMSLLDTGHLSFVRHYFEDGFGFKLVRWDEELGEYVFVMEHAE